MKRIFLFVGIVVSGIILSGCTGASQGDLISEEDANRLAVDHIRNSYQFNIYEGQSIRKIEELGGGNCQNCHRLVYELEIGDRSELAEGVLGFRFTYLIEGDEISTVDIEEI